MGRVLLCSQGQQSADFLLLLLIPSWGLLCYDLRKPMMFHSRHFPVLHVPWFLVCHQDLHCWLQAMVLPSRSYGLPACALMRGRKCILSFCGSSRRMFTVQQQERKILNDKNAQSAYCAFLCILHRYDRNLRKRRKKRSGDPK